MPPGDESGGIFVTHAILKKMSTRHFKKELPDTPIYLTTGKPIKFDILETADSWLISELDSAAKHGVGGIVPISPEQYAELAKKKQTETPWLDSFPRQANTLQAQPFQQPLPAVPVAVNGHRREMPDPIEIKDPAAFKPLRPKVAKVD